MSNNNKDNGERLGRVTITSSIPYVRGRRPTRCSPSSNHSSGETQPVHNSVERPHSTSPTTEGPLSEQPNSAANQLTLLAIQTNDRQLVELVNTPDQPILTVSGPGVTARRYSYTDFISATEDEAQRAIWNCMMAPNDKSTDIREFTVNIYLDDGPRRLIVKDKLREIFKDYNTPDFTFKGDVEERWMIFPKPTTKKIDVQGSTIYVQDEEHFKKWTDFNFKPMTLEETTQVIKYAGFNYKEDEDAIRHIHTIITIFSNYAICHTTRKILRNRCKNHMQTNAFEMLCNLMHANIAFKETHSLRAYAALVMDAAYRLHKTNYDYYLTEAIRSTTAGLCLDEQTLEDVPTRHVGILFPYKDFKQSSKDTNLKSIKRLEEACENITYMGGINFQQVINIQKECDDLLYFNNWTPNRPDDEDYVKDVLALVSAGIEIFGIDNPVIKEENSTDNEDTKDVKLQGKTYTL